MFGEVGELALCLIGFDALELGVVWGISGGGGFEVVFADGHGCGGGADDLGDVGEVGGGDAGHGEGFLGGDEGEAGAAVHALPGAAGAVGWGGLGEVYLAGGLDALAGDIEEGDGGEGGFSGAEAVGVFREVKAHGGDDACPGDDHGLR